MDKYRRVARIIHPETKKRLMAIPGAYDHEYPTQFYTSRKVQLGEMVVLTTDHELREWGITLTKEKEMWDWILISNIMDHIIGTSILLLILPALVFGFTSFVTVDNLGGNDREQEYNSMNTMDCWVQQVGRRVKTTVVSCIVLSLLLILPTVPKRILESNIARVKIHYTSPQSIAKIESGALQVVEKLDKLIDKGIESIGTGGKQ